MPIRACQWCTTPIYPATTGRPAGSPEEALDCACGLYLNDPTAWLQPPTN